jgi:hypothetical protein
VPANPDDGADVLDRTDPSAAVDSAGRRVPRRSRSGQQGPVAGRRVPWWWVAGALVALVLVGRGVGGTVSGGGSSRAGTAGVVAASVTTAPQPRSTGATKAVLPPPPTTPPSLRRVTLPQITVSSGTATGQVGVPTGAAGRAGAACSAQVVVAPFSGGYSAGLTVTNTGQTVARDWRLTFQLPDGQRLVNSWNGQFSVHGTVVSVTATSPNSTLAPAAQIQVGFQAQVGPSGGPYGFALNGVTCSS